VYQKLYDRLSRVTQKKVPFFTKRELVCHESIDRLSQVARAFISRESRIIVTDSKTGKPLMGTLDNEDDASLIMLAIRNRHLTENRAFVAFKSIVRSTIFPSAITRCHFLGDIDTRPNVTGSHYTFFLADS
jgi:hypothetical protein